MSTASNNGWDFVSDAEKSYIISNCESFGELSAAFDKIGPVRGSRKYYSPAKMKGKIEQLMVFLDGTNKLEDVPFNIFTRTYGIRAKAMELSYYHIKKI